MCVSPLAALSPIGSLLAGHRSINPATAMFSPLAAVLTAKKKPQPERLAALYPNGG
jgi:hypothetical protein